MKEKFGGEVTVITMGRPWRRTPCSEMPGGRRGQGRACFRPSFRRRRPSPPAMPSSRRRTCWANSTSYSAARNLWTAPPARWPASWPSASTLPRSPAALENYDEKNLTAQRELETGVRPSEASLPCLVTVEKLNYHARIPNLKGKLAAKGGHKPP